MSLSSCDELYGGTLKSEKDVPLITNMHRSPEIAGSGLTAAAACEIVQKLWEAFQFFGDTCTCAPLEGELL